MVSVIGIKRRAREEKGISTVIAVVSLLGLFGATMLSLDFGNMVSTRRTLITGTDATALQQARLESFTAGSACAVGGGGTPSWQDYLLRNAGSIVSGTGVCTRHPDPNHPGTGYIVVEARKLSDTRFGGMFGIGSTQPYSLSAAEYGYVTEAKGLRPMSFCNLDDHVAEWIALQNWKQNQLDGGSRTPNMTQTAYDSLRGSGPDHPVYSGAGVVHRMWETKTWSSGDCGPGASGNWGWQDFNCPSSCGNANPDLGNWIRNGFDGTVGIFDGAQSTCDDKDDPYSREDGCLNGTTGSRGSSLDSDLQYLVDNEIKFHVPIFKYICCNGNNVHFQVYGFLGVRMWGFGKQGNEHYFDFEYSELLLGGRCCSSAPPTPTNNKGVKLCTVDHDGDSSDATIASRCGQ